MQNNREWILISQEKSQVNQKVFYYFSVCGVFRGQYFGEDEEYHGGSVFGGPHGFLTGDVTHWMPDDDGELPDLPHCDNRFVTVFNKKAMAKCGMNDIPAPSGKDYRASGLCECEKCGNKFVDRPMDVSVLSSDGQPFLNVLCNGDRVKL